tara:strand:- start:5345 stop:5917 length:573 start_codon:yes stop_codon:yes gene_type:complete
MNISLNTYKVQTTTNSVVQLSKKTIYKEHLQCQNMSCFKNKPNEEKCGEATPPPPKKAPGPQSASYFVHLEKHPSVAYNPHPSQLFVSTGKISDGIETIPNMTDGLRLALQSLQIECVSQLLAELIKRVNGVSSDGETYLETKEEILEDYSSWLQRIATGSVVGEVDLKAITDTMAAFAEEHGLVLSSSD